MRNFLTAFLGILSFTLFSCQKEVKDIFGPPVNQNNTPGLLKKMVIKNGSDSTVTNYIYNSANQIIGINVTEVSSGVASTKADFIVRNGQGIIQKIITKASELATLGIDSAVSIVNYDGNSRHYTNRILKFSILGITFSDSLSYTYDASGKIIAVDNYLNDGMGTTDASRLSFTYANGNMTILKGYDLSSSTPVLYITEVFEYDAKPSPLVLGNEAWILNETEQWYSANNWIRQTVNLVGDPDTHIITYSNNYNTSNKPGTVTLVSDGQPAGTISYYYN
jgi:hypothetical protein